MDPWVDADAPPAAPLSPEAPVPGTGHPARVTCVPWLLCEDEDPCDDADPEDDCEPWEVGPLPPDCCPLEPLLEPDDPLLDPDEPPAEPDEPPLEPLLLCCDGNGDWLPPPDWLELELVLGVPPEVDGADEGDEVGIEGIDGMDVCVDDVTEQPTRPSVPAMAQTSALT